MASETPPSRARNLRDSAEMNIDRYMVNLFFEIKRNVPHRQQADLKISDPNIGSVMTRLYQETKDENTKLLVGVFLERAGEQWAKDAQKPKALPKMLKFLSANNSAEDSSQKSQSAKKNKPKRIYRGQVIDD